MNGAKKYLIPVAAAICAAGLFFLFTRGFPQGPRDPRPMPSFLDDSLARLKEAGKGGSDAALFLKRYKGYLAQIAAGNAFVYGKGDITAPVYDPVAFMANMDAERVGKIVDNGLSGRDAYEGLSGLVERAYLPEGAREPDSFLMYIPSGYDRTKRYPMVVVLHGYSGTVYLSPLSPAYADFLRGCEERGIIMLAPNGRHHLPAEPGGWVSPASEADAMKVVAMAREKYSVDPARIYVAGYSMGGYGAMHLAARHGDVFCAAASVCGGMPYSITDLSVFRGTPVFLAHGDRDPTVSVEESRGVHERLRMLGYECDYDEYPGVDHGGAVDRAFSGGRLLDWFLKKRKG